MDSAHFDQLWRSAASVPMVAIFSLPAILSMGRVPADFNQPGNILITE